VLRALGSVFTHHWGSRSGAPFHPFLIPCTVLKERWLYLLKRPKLDLL
jgi:hypothetical protein